MTTPSNDNQKDVVKLNVVIEIDITNEPISKFEKRDDLQLKSLVATHILNNSADVIDVALKKVR